MLVRTRMRMHAGARAWRRRTFRVQVHSRARNVGCTGSREWIRRRCTPPVDFAGPPCAKMRLEDLCRPAAPSEDLLPSPQAHDQCGRRPGTPDTTPGTLKKCKPTRGIGADQSFILPSACSSLLTTHDCLLCDSQLLAVPLHLKRSSLPCLTCRKLTCPMRL